MKHFNFCLPGLQTFASSGSTELDSRSHRRSRKISCIHSSHLLELHRMMEGSFYVVKMKYGLQTGLQKEHFCYYVLRWWFDNYDILWSFLMMNPFSSIQSWRMEGICLVFETNSEEWWKKSSGAPTDRLLLVSIFILMKYDSMYYVISRNKPSTRSIQIG